MTYWVPQWLSGRVAPLTSGIVWYVCLWTGGSAATTLQRDVAMLQAHIHTAAYVNCVQALRVLAHRYRHTLGTRLDDVPLGYVLGMTAVRVRARHSVLDALADYDALAEAHMWLSRADPAHTASNAWSALYLRWGMCYQALQRWGDAAAAYETAAYFTHTNTARMCRLAVCRADLAIQRGRYAEALRLMRGVWGNAHGRTRRAHLVFARALFHSGDAASAWDVLLACLARYGIDPKRCENDPVFALGLANMPAASPEITRQWYECLGMLLRRLPRQRTHERLAALLINQRAVMRMCLTTVPEDDDRSLLNARSSPRTETNTWSHE